jgi:hypothetical protein
MISEWGGVSSPTSRKNSGPEDVDVTLTDELEKTQWSKALGKI